MRPPRYTEGMMVRVNPGAECTDDEVWSVEGLVGDVTEVEEGREHADTVVPPSYVVVIDGTEFIVFESDLEPV